LSVVQEATQRIKNNKINKIVYDHEIVQRLL